MFACLFLPITAQAGVEPDALEAVARAFSPRVEAHAPRLVTLDIRGLQRLLGGPADIGRELLRDARDRGCAPNVAIASTRTAAMLLAVGRRGVTVVAPGEERRELAPLPLAVLSALCEQTADRRPAGLQGQGAADPRSTGLQSRVRRAADSGRQAAGDNVLPVLDLFRRWGLRTLGDIAVLPAPALSERIGQAGLRWQRLARGEDLEPLVAMAPEPPIEETLDLDWPVEGLEPLSFLLPRLLEPICARLERLDQAAVTLEMTFRLATREQVERRLQLPAPMRDAKVLRTLVLLHLESHPLGGGVDRLTVRVEPAPARIVQFSLLARALPFPEQIATLLARLSALMGERRVGAAAVVDSFRPGAFAIEPFTVTDAKGGGRKAEGGGRRVGEGGVPPHASRLAPPASRVVLRRFRLPVPARVMVQDGRPVRVATERHGLEGGRVEAAAGPWRTSGEWWRVGGEAAESKRACPERGHLVAESKGWNRDEWDVALSDGAVYRVYRDRTSERWFVEGILD